MTKNDLSTLGDSLLVMAGNPTGKKLRTFKKWRKKGFNVDRGEKAVQFNKSGKGLFSKDQVSRILAYAGYPHTPPASCDVGDGDDGDSYCGMGGGMEDEHRREREYYDSWP